MKRMASETKRLSKWKSDWLHQKDGAGDSFSEYFVKSDEFNTKCLWCKKLIFHGSAGRAALSQHAKSKGHCSVADSRKQRNVAQMLLVSTDEDKNNNDDEGIVDENETRAQGEEKRLSLKTRTFVLQKLSAPPTLPNNRLGLEDQVTAAGALLVMKADESDWSYAPGRQEDCRD